MTELEKRILPSLIDSGIIKSYIRYVDDTLVMIKESEIQNVMDRFNSFDRNLKSKNRRWEDSFLGYFCLAQRRHRRLLETDEHRSVFSLRKLHSMEVQDFVGTLSVQPREENLFEQQTVENAARTHQQNSFVEWFSIVCMKEDVNRFQGISRAQYDSTRRRPKSIRRR